jgi:hypothetical protein
MVRIRLFEETLAELYGQGRLVGVVHLSVGQEATAVGVCSALRDGDQITSTHRGHHHMVARGLDPQPAVIRARGRSQPRWARSPVPSRAMSRDQVPGRGPRGQWPMRRCPLEPRPRTRSLDTARVDTEAAHV